MLCCSKQAVHLGVFLVLFFFFLVVLFWQMLQAHLCQEMVSSSQTGPAQRAGSFSGVPATETMLAEVEGEAFKVLVPLPTSPHLWQDMSSLCTPDPSLVPGC